MTRPSIVLADDHPVVLSGLRQLIQATDEFNLVGEAMTGLAALELVHTKVPDVLVLDISMPGLNGIALAKHLAGEGSPVRIVVLTVHEDHSYVSQALEAGVHGYVLKRSLVENLVQAIRAVARNETYLDPAIGSQFMESHHGSTRKLEIKSLVSLTSRESNVLKLTALGETNKEIAQQLQLSVKSVETFKSRGVKKLGLRTRSDIVRYAAARGWFADL